MEKRGGYVPGMGHAVRKAGGRGFETDRREESGLYHPTAMIVRPLVRPMQFAGRDSECPTRIIAPCAIDCAPKVAA
jgi:hypothetical protein